MIFNSVILENMEKCYVLLYVSARIDEGYPLKYIHVFVISIIQKECLR